MKANQLVWALLLAGVTAVKLSAQTLQTLATFNGTNGASPYGNLTLGKDGNFYGTTYGGGIYNNPDGDEGCGTIFQVTAGGTLTMLVSFNFTNGAYPYAGLTLGNDGNFYGTTSGGGITNSTDSTFSLFGAGTVFKVTTNGILTTLVSFAITNGAEPNAGLTLGNDGNFYGTTTLGGYTNLNSGYGYGTVFKVTTNGMLTTLGFFNGTNGADPYAALTLGDDGNFYGTTDIGGSNDDGIVFKVTTNGSLSPLVSFNFTNGANPVAALTLGEDGNFYGSTAQGGITNSPFFLGNGTIFRVTTNGVLTTLVSFNFTNGASPQVPLTLGNDGYFYGTTGAGGITNSNYRFGWGTIFQLTTNGSLTTVVSLANTNGGTPNVLILGNDGNFYGTTDEGGSSDAGTVFSLSLLSVVPPVVIPPTLTLELLSGYPLLSMYGTLGDTYTLEYATNLAAPDWTPMLIVPDLSISPFQMIDPAGVGQPMRFYRAVQSQ